MAAKKKTTRQRAEPKKKPALKKKGSAKKKPAPAPKRKAAAKPTKRKVAPRTSKRPSAKRPVAKKKVASTAKRGPANPEGLELAKAVAGAALDKKANDVVVLDLSHKAQSVGYDYLVLATGDSDVQLEALKNGVEVLLDQRHRRASSVEKSPDWVCLNLDDVVVHFFTPEKREMYDLEGLWSDAARIAVA